MRRHLDTFQQATILAVSCTNGVDVLFGKTEINSCLNCVKCEFSRVLVSCEARLRFYFVLFTFVERVPHRILLYRLPKKEFIL